MASASPPSRLAAFAMLAAWSFALALLGCRGRREDATQAARVDVVEVISVARHGNASSDLSLADGSTRTLHGFAIENRPQRLALALGSNGDILDARPLEGPPPPPPSDRAPAAVPALGAGESGILLTTFSLGVCVLVALGFSMSAKRRDAGAHVFAVPYVLLVLGVGWLALGDSFVLMKRGQRVEAVVAERRQFRIASGKGGTAGPAYELGARRLDEAGSHRLVVDRVSEATFERFPMGSRISVLVLPDDPRASVIGREAWRPTVLLLLLVAAALVGVVSIGFATHSDDPF